MSNAGVLTVDMNSDMGEGFGAWRLGDDAAALEDDLAARVEARQRHHDAGTPQEMAARHGMPGRDERRGDRSGRGAGAEESVHGKAGLKIDYLIWKRLLCTTSWTSVRTP